jgi:hypothetical protein
MNPIPVHLAVEDALGEAVLRRLLAECGGPWAIGNVYGHGGVGYLRKMIAGFNNAAQGVPFIVLADTDQANCAPELLATWLPNGARANLLLRFAVREVEAWVLADCLSLAQFMGVRRDLLPPDVEGIADPKRALVNIARRSRRRDIGDDLVPKRGSTALVGRNYNARLQDYVDQHWRPHIARQNSGSLNRAIAAIDAFVPSWV